jgi:Bacterial Ig domain
VPENTDAETYTVIVFGLILFALACWVLFVFGRRRDEITGAPVGVALTAFGLLFAALATSERVSEGLINQTYSHYTTFALLVPVGCGLTLLSEWAEATVQKDSATAPSARYHMGLRVMTPILATVILLQLSLGTGNGLSDAGGESNFLRVDARATVNGSESTDPYDVKILLSGCLCPGLNLPRLIQIARAHHLSTFGTGAVATYLKEGLPRDAVPPETWVTSPFSGSTLHRYVFLTAGATSDEYSVTRVDFLLSGGGFHDATIARATLTYNGWLAGWNSATVPNGSYQLLSVAYDATGKSGRSKSISIRVSNP